MAYVDGQVLTAEELNTSFDSKANVGDVTSLQSQMAQIVNGTAADAGTLLGPEIFTLSRGAGALSTSLTKIATATAQTLTVFTQTGTGTVPETLQTKLAAVCDDFDFGIVGDGSDETVKIVNAITVAASTGRRLRWRSNKTYGFTNITVNLAGGIFDWAGNPNFVQLAARNNAIPGIQMGGANVATVALAASASAGAYQIQLADASMVQPGYLIRLLTDKLAFGDHRFDPNNALGQLVKVAAVAGNIVTLRDPLTFDLPIGSITTGTAQAGTAANITLAAGDTSTAAQLNNYLLTITGGTGAGQSRYINSYNATTKVADIGTTYTSFSQAPFSPAPDNTSVYSVAATCSAQIINPAFIKDLGKMTATGFATSALFVYGVQLQLCDRPQIDGITISGFSRMALYTRFNYFPKVTRSHFFGANEADSSGGGLGYGHNSLGDYGCIVDSCSATGCRTGFDGINGTTYLKRNNCTVVGGGLAYDGNPFWPAPSGYPNSGVSNHTGTFGVTDTNNDLVDVWDNKNRAYWHVAHNNTIRGYVMYPYYIFYSTGGDYRGNTFIDGMTNVPSSGMNANINGTETPVTNASIVNRPAGMFNIQQAGMVPYADITIDGNRSKSSYLTGIYISNPDSASTMGLYVTNNDIDIVANVVNSCSVITGDAGTMAFRDLKVANNELRAGGSALGTVKVDNMVRYPIFAQIATTAPFAVQIGVTKYMCILPNNTATDVALPLSDQSTFQLSVYEKDFVVPNRFFGLVQRGNATAIETYATPSTFALSIAALTGTTGTAGNVTVSIRSSDGRTIIENRSGSTGRFILEFKAVID